MAIRIDELPTTLTPSLQHLLPAMKDGVTVALAVNQIVNLALDIVRGDVDPSLDDLEKVADLIYAINEELDDHEDILTSHGNTLTSLAGLITALQNDKLNKSGGTMTGNLDMGNNLINNVLNLVTTVSLTGQIAFFPMNSPPTGWLKSNGAVLTRASYTALFGVLGTAYNTGGETGAQFRIPDLRGEFIRFADDGAGIDVGRSVGTKQAGTRHPWIEGNGNLPLQAVNVTPDFYDGTGPTVPRQYSSTTPTFNGNITQYYLARPRNVALLGCIRV